MKVAIRVNAGNDTNGNPRRGWVIYEASGSHLKAIDFVNEGYSGTEALAQSGYSGIAASSEPIVVSPGLFREWKKSAKHKGEN